jgi:hypothetical protein
MTMKLLVIPALATLLAACGGTARNPDVKAGISKDTLAYQYKTFKQRADNCGNKPDSGCTVIKIVYPTFTSDAALTDSVKKGWSAYLWLAIKPIATLKHWRPTL